MLPTQVTELATQPATQLEEHTDLQDAVMQDTPAPNMALFNDVFLVSIN